MEKKNLRSDAMRLFNYLKKSITDNSEAMRKAWAVAKFQAALKSGAETVIRFFKENDEIPQQRVAVAINETNYQSKGSDRKKPALQILFFDKGYNAIRSFNAARFDGFVVA